MDTAISIHNISKQYFRSGNEQPYLSLRDVVSNTFKKNKNSKEAFWALQDIDLEIKQGERVGIIGRNGAGKSTLLKIISRITPPTKGRIELNGRVASLLEVGTGFHPELSGHENIYLNGSILGLKRTEINDQLKNIIEFSGVENFIDSPLKNYSSGMQLRLAFSVAAHLQAEILLIDEVLAVGDAEFQKKCIGKMEEISRSEGRTILFVSHNMSAIKDLCDTSVWLQNGRTTKSGIASDVIEDYINSIETGPYTAENIFPEKENIFIQCIRLMNQEGKQTLNFQLQNPILISLQILRKTWKKIYSIAFAVNDIYGKRIFRDQFTVEKFPEEEQQIVIKIPNNVLAPGLYTIDFSILSENEVLDLKKNALRFDIVKTGTKYEYYLFDYGFIDQHCEWKVQSIK